MKKVSCVSRTAAAAAAALLLLSGCETPVPIWQPPLGSGETSGAGSQTVTPGTAPVTDLSTSDVKQPAPVVQAQSPGLPQATTASLKTVMATVIF